MDGIGTATAALGALVLLAAAVRGTVTASRAAASRARAAGRAAAAHGRAAGAHGLLAALAGSLTLSGATATASAATAAPAPRAGHPVPAPATYVVRAGDSLWAIAADHLGPGASNADIAAEWPRWYRANRAAVGRNPSLLLVGTLLQVPHGRPTGTSASPHLTPAPSGSDRTAQSLDPDRR